MLPLLARKEVDRLVAELQDAQFKLEATPTTTNEFVNSLTFLDDIQIRVSSRNLKCREQRIQYLHSEKYIFFNNVCLLLKIISNSVSHAILCL